MIQGKIVGTNRAVAAKIALVVALATVAASGCGSSKVVEAPVAFVQLREIGRAYFAATQNLDRPPANKEELLAALKETGVKSVENPADVFRSTDDGEDFVILWNVDLMNLPGAPDKQPVLAYEKTGKEGRRWVLQSYRVVRRVPDDKMAELPFPEGVRNPFR